MDVPYIKSIFFDTITFYFKSYDSRKTNNTSFDYPIRWVQNTRRTIYSSFRGCHATSPLKSVFFTRKVAWQPLIELHNWDWHLLTPISRAKKWGIICLCNLNGSLSNPLQSKISEGVGEDSRNALYKWETFIVWAFTPQNHKIRLHDLPVFVFINIPVTDHNYTKLWEHMGACVLNTHATTWLFLEKNAMYSELETLWSKITHFDACRASGDKVIS